MTIVILSVAILAAALLAGAYFLFDFSCRRKPQSTEPKESQNPYAAVKRETAEDFMALHPEQVSIRSFDGLKLSAYFLPAVNAVGAVIMMHGYRAYGLKDFSTSYDIYRSMGFHVLIPDQRACGESQGEYITFGIRERRDCADWAATLDQRLEGRLPIVLHGLSLGCATVLMCTALSLPKSVRCVVADCGFTSPKAIMAKVMKQWFHLPAFPLMYIANIYTRWIAGFGIQEFSTLQAMENNRLPVLFLHGEKDDFVPIEMTRQNYAACRSPKELVTVPQAGHALSILTDKPRCTQAIQSFVKEYAL